MSLTKNFNHYRNDNNKKDQCHKLWIYNKNYSKESPNQLFIEF